ncbi:hypothetical protein SDC9_187174 [bioreactor metagenome]|uniref:Uncharacterized protein n=1 Tax=bioreactor metagenome TaxID=1076179 RepID=A0A645HM73_9ZZZZ
MFEPERKAATGSHAKQLVRTGKQAAFRPADQGFIAENGAHPEIQNGLKHRFEKGFVKQSLQLGPLIIHDTTHSVSKKN